MQPFKLHKLDDGPSTTTTCSREEAMDYYKKMQSVRRMENSLSNLYKDKKIRGFCHLYVGQEAVAVGIEAALRPTDAVITAYRCHAFVNLRGSTQTSIIAELLGKRAGNVGGKGGSMHMYANEFYGGNGIVGAQVPLGAGIALQKKRQGKGDVCVTLYGDGAANQGQVFEAFNMAKLWNLPCIFICENNKYGMGTSAARSSASVAYYTRGDYIPGIWIDGMDVLTVREALRFATDWCRSGKGPIVLETETYRYFGHSMSDPGTSYRTRDEVQSMRKQRDPISYFTNLMITKGLATEEEIKAEEKAIRKDVDANVQKAFESTEPDLSSAYTHIFKEQPKNFTVRGCDLSILERPSE